MHSTIALFIALFGVPAVIQLQQHDTTVVEETPWQTYGYIALGAVVLIVIVVVLIRKQHRKFNE